MRPRTVFGGGDPAGTQPQTRGQAADAPAAAPSAGAAAGTGQLGGIDGLADVSVSTRVTSAGDACRLPVVYRLGSRRALQIMLFLHLQVRHGHTKQAPHCGHARVASGAHPSFVAH